MIGADEAQQRAKSLIEELLSDQSYSHQNARTVQNMEQSKSEPEKKQDDIDWDNFDWAKANAEYVRCTDNHE